MSVDPCVNVGWMTLTDIFRDYLMFPYGFREELSDVILRYKFVDDGLDDCWCKGMITGGVGALN